MAPADNSLMVYDKFCVAIISTSPLCGYANKLEKDDARSHSILYFVIVSPPIWLGDAYCTVNLVPDVTANCTLVGADGTSLGNSLGGLVA